MKIIITTYDTEIKAFGPTFDCRNKETAIRMFEDGIKHSADLREHKDTLELVMLGAFNEIKGSQITPCYEVLKKGKTVKVKDSDDKIGEITETE